MAIIAQQPTRLDLIGVSGDPFGLTVTMLVTDADHNPIPWSDVTDPIVDLVDGNNQSISGVTPTITSPSSGEYLLSWTGDQTELLDGYAKWSLSVTISGVGPFAVLAGAVQMSADTIPGTSCAPSTNLAVSVGNATVLLEVTLSGGGASIGSITAAVAAETTRATTAEALKAAKSANLSDLGSLPTALTNLADSTGAAATLAGVLSGTFVPTNPAISGIVYNALGQVTGYVEGGVTFAVTYNALGQAVTLQSTPGVTRTVSYNASGQVTGVA